MHKRSKGFSQAGQTFCVLLVVIANLPIESERPGLPREDFTQRFTNGVSGVITMLLTFMGYGLTALTVQSS